MDTHEHSPAGARNQKPENYEEFYFGDYGDEVPLAFVNFVLQQVKTLFFVRHFLSTDYADFHRLLYRLFKICVHLRNLRISILFSF